LRAAKRGGNVKTKTAIVDWGSQKKWKKASITSGDPSNTSSRRGRKTSGEEGPECNRKSKVRTALRARHTKKWPEQGEMAAGWRGDHYLFRLHWEKGDKNHPRRRAAHRDCENSGGHRERGSQLQEKEKKRNALVI